MSITETVAIYATVIPALFAVSSLFVIPANHAGINFHRNDGGDYDNSFSPARLR